MSDCCGESRICCTSFKGLAQLCSMIIVEPDKFGYLEKVKKSTPFLSHRDHSLHPTNTSSVRNRWVHVVSFSSVVMPVEYSSRPA